MPIYEFFCKFCGEAFETLVMRKGEEIHCPKCDGLDIARKLSTFSAQGMKNSTSCGGCSSSSCKSCGSSG